MLQRLFGIIALERDWSLADNNPTDEQFEELAKPYPLHPRYGKKVGEHIGAHFYTIGQRKGLNIGGFPEALFVIGTNIEYNQIYVGMGKEHKGLYRKVLKVNAEELHWIRPDLALEVGESRRLQIRIRYRQPLQQGIIYRRESGMYAVFDEPQRGVTAGQFATWYVGDELIGSGVIAM